MRTSMPQTQSQLQSQPPMDLPLVTAPIRQPQSRSKNLSPNVVVRYQPRFLDSTPIFVPPLFGLEIVSSKQFGLRIVCTFQNHFLEMMENRHVATSSFDLPSPQASESICKFLDRVSNHSFNL